MIFNRIYFLAKNILIIIINKIALLLDYDYFRRHKLCVLQFKRDRDFEILNKIKHR